jgi:hypothetical protein
MNKFTIIIIIFAIAIITSAIIISNGKKSESNQQIASVISVDRESHDFGEIEIFAGKVETTYILTNEGEQDVIIKSAITSCMCTEGIIGKMKFGMHSATGGYVVIPAGGEETLTAIYDPLAHGPDGVGKITRELTVKTNSITTPEITVKLSANVVKNQ